MSFCCKLAILAKDSNNSYSFDESGDSQFWGKKRKPFPLNGMIVLTPEEITPVEKEFIRVDVGGAFFYAGTGEKFRKNAKVSLRKKFPGETEVATWADDSDYEEDPYPEGIMEVTVSPNLSYEKMEDRDPAGEFYRDCHLHLAAEQGGGWDWGEDERTPERVPFEQICKKGRGYFSLLLPEQTWKARRLFRKGFRPLAELTSRHLTLWWLDRREGK